jgi:hypothetical protein
VFEIKPVQGRLGKEFMERGRFGASPPLIGLFRADRGVSTPRRSPGIRLVAASRQVSTSDAM